VCKYLLNEQKYSNGKRTPGSLKKASEKGKISIFKNQFRLKELFRWVASGYY